MEKARQKKLTPSEIDGVQYRRAKTWQIILSQLSGGSSMAFYILTGMMSYLANEGYGIAVAAAGAILSATRIFDGAIDPIIAVVTDKLNTRFGKIRILMLAGWVIRALAAMVLFVWGSGKGHGSFVFIAVFLVYITGNSTVDIAHNVVPPVMTNDPRQRPLIGVWGTVFNYLFPMAFTLVTNLVILPMYGNEYTVPMLATTCTFFVIASLVLMLVAFIGITPIDKPENFQNLAKGEDEEKVRVRDMLRFLRDNRPFQMYTISAASDKLAQQVLSQTVVSTLLFGILIGDLQMGTLLNTVSMLPAILFAIIGGRYAGKYGSKNTVVTWTMICTGLALVSVLLCTVIDMRRIPSSIALMVAFFGLMMLMNGAKMCVTTGGTAMRADIIDYELDRSGKYMPAVVTATYNFIDQIVSALSTTIALGCVALVGFKTVMPQPTDEPSTPIFWVTMFLYYGLPIIGWACTLVAMRFYRLTKPEMVQVQKRISAQKQAILEAEAAPQPPPAT